MINVRDYGAAGDGLADDISAFKAALAAMPAAGGWLYAPTGVYRLTEGLFVTGRPFRLVGDGIDVSVLRWDAGATPVQWQPSPKVPAGSA